MSCLDFVTFAWVGLSTLKTNFINGIYSTIGNQKIVPLGKICLDHSYHLIKESMWLQQE